MMRHVSLRQLNQRLSQCVYYSAVHTVLKTVLIDYTLQQVIAGSNPRQPHVYDQQDAFYLPIDNFTGVVRPGPTFRIYVKDGVRLAR